MSKADPDYVERLWSPKIKLKKKKKKKKKVETK